MNSNITAQPEVLQLCQEIIANASPDVSSAYVKGVTEGLSLGVMLMLACYLFLLISKFLIDFDSRPKRKRRIKQSNKTEQKQGDGRADESAPASASSEVHHG
ncbi:hypothetical protein LVJ82_17645 [Vitreoscilla massiliensis]|uniref:Uncharacterized protein n=1 Tax=Vitreoscilla massiliensis TaxID=1689272 RepID=A0ABY4E0D3_9NEIS|nr:hypothetical protein [Vitreoscilla massiliensis]UOO89242.1 hypothetical protein LVJ82_17645 [Vitreoscilla massiliensis]